jgi:Tol biopolymer transport system component
MKNRVLDKTPIAAFTLAAVIVLAINALTQTPPRENGKIAFTSDRDGNREIYVMEEDGSGQVRLTTNTIEDDHPTWSPDGTKIAFLSQRASGEFAIFVMNADGGGRTEITPITVSNFRRKIMTWSPDGRHLAINHTNGLDIIDADGDNRRFLTFGFAPAWSPDGSKILFVLPRVNNTPGSLNTIRPDGTDLRLFAVAMPWGSISGYPDWSPDGSRIALIGGDNANQDMFMFSSGGTGPFFVVNQCRSLFPEGCGSINSLAWSPDSSKIVYGAFGSLYTVDGYGVGQAAITSNEGNSHPSWQPLASAVSISGRVTTPGGQALRNALVALTDPKGMRRTATTSSLGLYEFTNVPIDVTYIASISSRRYRFAPRSITANGNLANIDFVGLE